MLLKQQMELVDKAALASGPSFSWKIWNINTPYHPTPVSSEFTSKDIIRLTSKRIEELRLRGFPEAWIERDIEKLVEGL